MKKKEKKNKNNSKKIIIDILIVILIMVIVSSLVFFWFGNVRNRKEGISSESYDESFIKVHVNSNVDNVVITFVSDEVEVLLNSEVDLKNYLESVIDKDGNDLKDEIVISGEVDTKKLGDYDVIYSVVNGDNEISEKKLIIHVVEKLTDDNGESSDDNTSNDSNSISNSSGSNTSSNTGNGASSSSSGNTGSSSVSSVFKNKVNSVSLNPIYTRYTPLDNQIGSILSSIINNGMSNYDKLMAMYNYVQNKLYYSMPILNMNNVYNMVSEYHYMEFDATEIELASEALASGYGVCDSYAALFMIMTRRVGFDSYVFNGQVNKVGGGTTGHAWVVINVGGTYYTFDPQIEDYGTYDTYFGKTSSELNIYYYEIEPNISRFNYFRETKQFGTSINISGLFTDSVSFMSYQGETKYGEVTANGGEDNTININISMDGSGDYCYIVNVSKNGGAYQNLHSCANRSGANEMVSYTFDETGSYKIMVSTTDYGVNANNYYYLMVTFNE